MRRMKSRPVRILLAERSISDHPYASERRKRMSRQGLKGREGKARGAVVGRRLVRPTNAWRAKGRPDCGARRPQHPSPNTTHILWAANPARSWGLGRSLVLNATDEPLRVVPSRRAAVLVPKAKAEIVSANCEGYHPE